VPEWFRSRVSNKAVFATSQWQESFPYCKGLFTLSNYHKMALEQYINVPVCALKHPTPFDVIKWSPKAFNSNKKKRIIQIGWWLRKLHAIYELPKSDYTKTFLRVSKDPYMLELIEKEKAIHIEKGLFDPEMYESAELIDYVPDEQYDKMLMENIVFLDLYDSSANNAIIECIARETPILVNPILPVIEYLGEEYPLYYSNYREAIEKATDYKLVLEAHNYLKSFSIKSELTGDYFRNSLISAPFMQASQCQS
jgi:hypothetical protein